MLTHINKRPEVSIIVPVYKVEDYLSECIESVLTQTFTNLELILVDDGSPDNSGAICDAYATRDQRIRVFHKENGGVTSARRLGVERSSGKWIMFVDSDDKLFPNALESLLKISRENQELQLVEGQISGKESRTLKNDATDKLHYAREHAYMMQIGVPFCTAPYAKIIRKTCFGNGEFDIPRWIVKGEDHLMLDRIALRVSDAAKTGTFVYFYRKNPTSVSHQVQGKVEYLLKYIDFLKTWHDLSSEKQRLSFGVHIQRIFISMFLFTKNWRTYKADLIRLSNYINVEKFPKSLGYKVCDLSNRLPFPLREFSCVLLKLRMRWKQFVFRKISE